MTFAITCDLTGTTARTGCGCPGGHDPAQAGEHHGDCGLHPAAMHALLSCTAACCGQHGDDGHDHHPAECTAEHGPCPSPDSCRMWISMRSHVPDPDAAGMPRACPGGHHGYGVPGCVVCHPLTITFLPDEPARLQMARGA